MSLETGSFEVSSSDLNKVFELRHTTNLGWGPRLRSRFRYFNPDEYYEAVVNKLVTANCMWLDVGCGRHVFPSNIQLAGILSKRCGLLVGVDPDETIEENTIVHRRYRTTIEKFQNDQLFDLITLRMVAEHVTDPERVALCLAGLTKPGGKVVIYTVNRWSPISLLAKLVPLKFHYSLKRLLWPGEEEKDTFPVSYRMNTRSALRLLFENFGFQEQYFAYLDDCRSFSRFRATLFVELFFRTALHSVQLPYPENCLLGVYERL